MQAREETVIKVSQNRKDEEEEEAEEDQEPAAGPTPASGSEDLIAAALGGGGSGAGNASGGQPDGDVKPKETKKKKDKEHKHRDHMSAEAEVDRIIDAQDNEYILSKPKCVGRDIQTFNNFQLDNAPPLSRGDIRAMQLNVLLRVLRGAGTAHLGSRWIHSSSET